MTKISEIVQINSGYTSYVDLYEDYYDLVKNRGRMERYKPIAAHREAFGKIANALNPLDRRVYFLSGSYGTGKSHLLLMLANFFANPSDVPELETFFQNYEAAQADVLLKPGQQLEERNAASLKAARKSGRFLVALCRYDLNLDFEGALLRSLEEALQRDETNILVDSHFLEALRRIRDWESRRNTTRFYSDLELAISRLFQDWTVNDVIDGLEQYDDKALKAFKACFQSVTDSEFTYKKDNLRDIISDFLKSPEFKKRYQGVVFLYDEFGAAIDANLVNYTTLLDFAQFCANSTMGKGGTVVFIGTGHKTFRNHGQVGDLNAETLAARVTEIGLQTQGMEDIIAAIVQPKKESNEWIQQIQSQSGKFVWFSSECNRLHLFNWLPAPKIKNNIIQNIYPMHPLATFALLRLAGEAGSDNRSVFTFFAPEFDKGEIGWLNVQPHSYPWFIENNEITQHNKLSLYTPDYLVDYFSEGLKASNNRLIDRVKQAVVNYEATLRKLNEYGAREAVNKLFEEPDQLMLKIMKVMLVNEIASIPGTVDISNTVQNITFALDYVSQDEITLVETRLDLLYQAGILFRANGVYEFVPSNSRNVPGLVDQYKANPENRPSNLLESFLSFSPLRGDENFLEARDYNSTFNEDKRLKVVFATPSMLAQKQNKNGQAISFFDAIEQDRLQGEKPSNDFEGFAVYAFCENDTDLDAAKKAVAQNKHSRIITAIPRNPIRVYDAIITLEALKSDWFVKQSEGFNPYEKAEEKKIRDEATGLLAAAKAAYFSNAKVYWFGVNGIEILVHTDKRHEAANSMILSLFGTKRNAFGHSDFNRIHINLSGQVRAIFKEAGDLLCDLSQPIRLNWSWPDNRGGTKYLRKCFVDHQALRVLTVEGDTRYFEAEKDITKFQTAFPAYAKLLADLAALEGKGQVNMQRFLKPFFEEFGQGEMAITLFLLLARRFYGDSLRFKREPNNLADIQFDSTEDMLTLVQGQYPSAVIIFEPVSAEDQTYFAKISQIFHSQPAPAGKVYTISEANQAAINWWDSLPIIARSLAFHSGDEKSLAEIFSQAKTKDPFHFIKYDLMELLGQVPGETLTPAKIKHIEARLREFKTAAESIQASVEDQILIKVAGIFGAPSHLDVDIQETFKTWYNGLSSTQKDLIGAYHNNDSKPLVKFTAYANIRELLFKTLPEAYSLESVDSWTSDRVVMLVQRIQSGKNHIENNAPQVSQPLVSFTNDVSQHGNQVTYQGELVLRVDTEDGQGVIYYTEDGSDPTFTKQPQKLTPGETLIIKANRIIKFVVADEKGNYSPIKLVEAINELEKHRIVRAAQPTPFDESVTFYFPKSKHAAEITFSSLVQEILRSELLSTDDLIKIISLLSKE